VSQFKYVFAFNLQP